MMSAFAFANIGMLAALLALPAIWYFLRLTPPKPRLEQFPPTRLLLELARKDEQPARSPWWLTALRLLLAAIIILALSGPVFRPGTEVAPGDGPLLLVMDNGWASAPQWPATLSTARRIVDIAQAQSRPIALLATAEPVSQSLAPTDGTEIIRRLEALAPRPWTPDHASLAPALAEAARHTAFGGAVWLSENIGGGGVAALNAVISELIAGPVVAYVNRETDILALATPSGNAEALSVPLLRESAGLAAGGLVRASDISGRVIGEAPFAFDALGTEAEARFDLPVELRNDIVRVEIVGRDSAGAVQLLDDRWQRRRIGLLSGTSVEAAQPLLSPLYYIDRAVQPFADVREAASPSAAAAVPDLIENGASIIVMADIGNLARETEDTVRAWVEDGGTLVRFAGPRLAAAADSLVPVRLRNGDRTIGGSLSWETPQPLASFAERSPFAGLPVPEDVLVRRQVLAEPDGTLAERTWAALADGTPLVTAAPEGNGWVILFHLTADTSWSNLPLSGTFVEMLRRIVAFSSSAPSRAGDGASQPLPPYRLLDGYGRFTAPTAEAEPVSGDLAAIQPGIAHPPGLYGTEEGFRALNVLDDAATLEPFDITSNVNASLVPYPTAAPAPLAPWLIALAILLLALDALAVLWLNGGLRWRSMRRAASTATVLLVAGLLLLPATASLADEESDRFAISAVERTSLAYVITGDPMVDETSKAGLSGLSQVLALRTALEPGDAIGVDPGRDELAFFPLIYWPVVAGTALPDSATMAKVDAYMRQGGSILFDTRDQLERTTTGGGLGGTPAAEHLRALLASLDIPPLEPVPMDHVLTKAFYLLNEFPGRYAGGPLWVVATDNQERADRPVQAGDGVSTILITENDLAGAWAVDGDGIAMYPTLPNDPFQREMAYRTGVNIVMYTLTGNYKADQVHVPALLERLGQ